MRHQTNSLDTYRLLGRSGLRVSPVMDRIYFKSIYTTDPDGHIVELATAGPGFRAAHRVPGREPSVRRPDRA